MFTNYQGEMENETTNAHAEAPETNGVYGLYTSDN